MQRHGNTKEVAKICECSLSHVQSTWKKYKENGVAAIAAVKMGRPKGTGSKIRPQQEEVIKELIMEKRPEETGLNGHLWGRAEVSELVRVKFGIEMPVRTMGHYLAKWNFTSHARKKRLSARPKSNKRVA